MKNYENLEKMLNYLDDLRSSGVTNMMAGPSYLIEDFDLTTKESVEVFTYWTEHFNWGENAFDEDFEKSGEMADFIVEKWEKKFGVMLDGEYLADLIYQYQTGEDK